MAMRRRGCGEAPAVRGTAERRPWSSAAWGIGGGVRRAAGAAEGATPGGFAAIDRRARRRGGPGAGGHRRAAPADPRIHRDELPGRAGRRAFHDIYPYSAHPLQLARRDLAERLRHARRGLSVLAQRAAAEARQPALDAVGLPGRPDAGPRLGRGGVPGRAAVAGLAERRGGRERPGGARVLRQPAPLGPMRAGGVRRGSGRSSRRSPGRSAPTAISATATVAFTGSWPRPSRASAAFRYPPKLLVFCGARHLRTRGRGLGPARGRAVRDAPRSSRASCWRRAWSRWRRPGSAPAPLRAWFDRPGRGAPVVRRAAGRRAGDRRDPRGAGPRGRGRRRRPGPRGGCRCVGRRSPGSSRSRVLTLDLGAGECVPRGDGPAIGLRGDAHAPWS